MRMIVLNGEAEGMGEDLSRKRIFTTGEAAAVCKVSQQTIIRCFDAGRLQGFRVPGSKFRRIPREEIIRFMKANNIPLEALEGGKRRILIVDDDPAIVDARTRFGDWEGDTVIGAAHQQALVTLNERTSRYCLIAHVPAKTAQAVSDAVISLLTPFADCVHTLTTDNGKEFAQHERIARTLGADFFFAHPYASWERGANENMNGLIRQFFPKKCRFDSITQKDIAHAMDRLNHRPRKCLGFKTPHEVFMTQLHLRHNSVALQT